MATKRFERALTHHGGEVLENPGVSSYSLTAVLERTGK
jgi:hypothetical protein